MVADPTLRERLSELVSGRISLIEMVDCAFFRLVAREREIDHRTPQKSKLIIYDKLLNYITFF